MSTAREDAIVRMQSNHAVEETLKRLQETLQ